MGERRTPLTPDELRFWRIYAAIQELCHADDDDLTNDKELEKFIRLAARAVRTYQDQKRDDKCAEIKKEVLKVVGIPMITPLKKK